MDSKVHGHHGIDTFGHPLLLIHAREEDNEHDHFTVVVVQ